MSAEGKGAGHMLPVGSLTSPFPGVPQCWEIRGMGGGVKKISENYLGGGVLNGSENLHLQAGNICCRVPMCFDWLLVKVVWCDCVVCLRLAVVRSAPPPLLRFGFDFECLSVKVDKCC